MFISEMFDDAKPGIQSSQDDNSVFKASNRRQRTRLTLAHLNRMRMANDVRKHEHEIKMQQVKKQYTPTAEAGGGLGI
jgi:hypothetical protein